MYTIFDTETTMNCPIGGNLAHPLWPGNRVVLWGTMGVTPSSSVVALGESGEPTFVGTIIGHNVKFDLLYALTHNWITPEAIMRHGVWDTQLAEYLLSGQQNQYASLDELTVRYGGEVKDSAVTEFFKAGKGADHVPMSLLKPYLEGDLINTELVYSAQILKVEAWGMEKLVHSQMRALAATTIMEYYGLKLDRTYIDSRIVELADEVKRIEDVLIGNIAADSRKLPTINPYSGKDLSLYLFGGTYTETVRTEVGLYKNGKPKFKNVDVVHKVDGLFDPSTYTTMGKNGWYVVDEKVLKSVPNVVSKLVCELREKSKYKTTYFEGMRDLIFPGDFIHASLNHVSTKTGRLSCTKPNIQNQTEAGGVKRAYVSRFGEHGRLVEFDYSQLEMVALAYLSNDTQLLDDIGSGKDMHTELFVDMYGRKPTKDERKWFKRLSFGLVYGAGAKTLAENAGCSVADAKKFIKIFYSRYVGVKKWHEESIDHAARNGRVSKEHCKESGRPIRKYTQRTDTGRIYVYREYWNDWKKEMSFSPTELKNYRVQGFATGDVVPFMVGHIVYALLAGSIRDSVYPVMTVHDSIVFDVHEKVLDKFVKWCYSELKRTTSLVNSAFDIAIPINLEVGCKVGLNWQEMEEVTF